MFVGIVDNDVHDDAFVCGVFLVILLVMLLMMPLMILLCVVAFFVCVRGMEQSMKITKVDCISTITPSLFLTIVDEVLEMVVKLSLK